MRVIALLAMKSFEPRDAGERVYLPDDTGCHTCCEQQLLWGTRWGPVTRARLTMGTRPPHRAASILQYAWVGAHDLVLDAKVTAKKAAFEGILRCF